VYDEPIDCELVFLEVYMDIKFPNKLLPEGNFAFASKAKGLLAVGVV